MLLIIPAIRKNHHNFETTILRQMYSAVQPGYHMNKRHWNTVSVDDSIPDEEIRQMVDSSYNLVVKGLKKADREALLAEQNDTN